MAKSAKAAAGTSGAEAEEPAGEARSLRVLLTHLGDLTLRVSSSLDEAAVLQDIVDAACELTSAKYGAMGVLDDSGRIQKFITHGITQQERERIGGLPKGDGILGLLHEVRRPVRLADLTAHPRSVGFPLHHPLMESFLGVPIRRGDESLGNLYLTVKEGAEEFTVEDEELVAIFASQAAMAIVNARRFQAEQKARLEAESARRAQAESEQLHRLVLDNTTAVIYLKDTDGRYITVNRRYEDLFHVDREEIRGKSDHDIFPKETADSFKANDMEVLHAAVPMEWEEVAPHDDGPHAYISVKYPLLDSHGAPYAVCGISTDITVRREIEQMKADFLSMVSHDLRGPLSNIKGLSSSFLMEGGPKDTGRAVEYIGSIDEEADRMAELVGNLLDMSRIEANSMPLDPEVCHLADLVSETVRRVERSRAGGDHKITTDVPLELPEVYVDYDQIGRVLENLLSNAIKYSPTGSAIRVGSRLDEDRNGFIVTEVSDQGIGIPEAEADKIFDKFYRVTAEGGRTAMGSGLGLAICKAIVDAHHGHIWVESEYGKGSNFFFRLPSVH